MESIEGMITQNYSTDHATSPSRARLNRRAGLRLSSENKKK